MRRALVLSSPKQRHRGLSKLPPEGGPRAIPPENAGFAKIDMWLASRRGGAPTLPGGGGGTGGGVAGGGGGGGGGGLRASALVATAIALAVVGQAAAMLWLCARHEAELARRDAAHAARAAERDAARDAERDGLLAEVGAALRERDERVAEARSRAAGMISVVDGMLLRSRRPSAPPPQ